MKPTTMLGAILALCALILAPSFASAQDTDPTRVQQAIDATDDRLEKAQLLIENTDNRAAELELNMAIGLQARAKTAFSAGQYRLALGLTLEARVHIEKALRIAQGPDPDRVLAQLERTSELLERARDAIEECDSDRARALLRVAVEMQERAEASFKDGRINAALQLTMSARERILRALRLCRVEENLSVTAERALARTDEVIARARDQVTGSGGEQARQALGRAIELQQQATAEFRAQRFEACLRLTQSARALAHRAIRLANAGL